MIYSLKLDQHRRPHHNDGSAFNHAGSFDRLNKELADNRRYSGFFTSVAIALPSRVGHSREALTPAGFQFAGLSTLLCACHPRLTAGGGLLKPKLEAFTMPKHARTLLSYSVIIALTLAFERGASVAVILATLATFASVHLIGSTQNDN